MTLTIEEDVAAHVLRLRRERDASLKRVVNELLREGIASTLRPKKREPFRTKVYDTGKALIPNIDNVAEVIAAIEGDDYK